MTAAPAHQWIVTPDGSSAAPSGGDAAPPPSLTPAVDAHRRLRGPYTAAGTMARAVVPGLLERAPELVSAHEIELLTAAPEVRALITPTRETLTSLAVPKERTRFYSRMRTLRIAHGLTDFVRDLAILGPEGAGPQVLVFFHVDQADQTDQEFISVLLRRIPAALLTLTVVTAAGATLEPPLSAALERYTVRGEGAAAPFAAPDPNEHDPLAAARAYIAGECLDSGPAMRAAYVQTAADVRASLHDERAAELEALGQGSLRLGAIPFHRALGADPRGAGINAHLLGADWCLENGLYHAAVELALRGLELFGADEDHELDTRSDWWNLTTKVTTSYAALDRAVEAKEMYDIVRSRSTSPNVHMHAAYATAMLYTRHLPEEQRDHKIALGWSNIAIAFASQLGDSVDQAFHTVFQQNGRALIEAHLGNPDHALDLVSGGLARLDAELGEGEQSLHRSVLRHNRAQVLKGLGRYEEARADYESVIAQDPNYAEYHFEFAGLLRRLGLEDRALAEYETAMKLTPPFVELYYNRGDLRAVRGDLEGALADFNYALELDPEYVDAYVNRAALLLRLGDVDGAGRDVDAGLALAPANAHLRCQRARILKEDGALESALDVLDQVVQDEPKMGAAWALRAETRFEAARLPEALADMNRALELEQSAVAYFNRGVVLEALDQWAEAAEDYTRSIGGDESDPDSWLHRASCRVRTDDLPGAHADLDRFRVLAPDRGGEADEIEVDLRQRSH